MLPAAHAARSSERDVLRRHHKRASESSGRFTAAETFIEVETRKGITIAALESSATLIPVVGISRTRDHTMLDPAVRRPGHDESPVTTLK